MNIFLRRDSQNDIRTLGKMFTEDGHLRKVFPFDSINYAGYLRSADSIHCRKDRPFYAIRALSSYFLDNIIRQFGIVTILAYAKRIITTHSSFLVSVQGVIGCGTDKQVVGVYT